MGGQADGDARFPGQSTLHSVQTAKRGGYPPAPGPVQRFDPAVTFLYRPIAFLYRPIAFLYRPIAFLYRSLVCCKGMAENRRCLIESRSDLVELFHIFIMCALSSPLIENAETGFDPMGNFRIPGQICVIALMMAKIRIDESIDFELDIFRNSLRPRNGQCIAKGIHNCTGFKKKRIVTQPCTLEATRGLLGIQDMPQP